MSVDCPSCDKTLKNERGMRLHHTKSHNERLPNTNCDNCGKGFYRKPSHKRDSMFCSEECMGEYRSNEYTGDGNPNYSDAMTQSQCENCGETIKHRQSVERTYCSYECMGKARTGGPHSRVDPDNVRYYGPNWQKQRRKRVVKDCGRCVVCGMTDSKHHEKVGTGLHVHHINSVSDEIEDVENPDWTKVNRIDNLVTLCWKDHQKWESIPLTPQYE